VQRPETRYARSGDVDIAYQVVGNGPRDLVLVPGWVSNIDVFREDPSMARFLERLSSFPAWEPAPERTVRSCR
jgi:pimeloyl-ACP methyl ester carboxylesterase